MFHKVCTFVSAEIKSSTVFESAAGALGTVVPRAKVATTATTADLISLVLNTDFPRIQIMEVGLYPSSMRELMPNLVASQSTLAKKFKILNCSKKEISTHRGAALPLILG